MRGYGDYEWERWVELIPERGIGIGWMRIVVSWPARVGGALEPAHHRPTERGCRRCDEAGMTLVEVMISAVVLAMVMLALSASLRTFTTYAVVEKSADRTAHSEK